LLVGEGGRKGGRKRKCAYVYQRTFSIFVPFCCCSIPLLLPLPLLLLPLLLPWHDVREEIGPLPFPLGSRKDARLKKGKRRMKT